MPRSTSRPRAPRNAKESDKQRQNHDERMLDKALEDTFPASDPPAQTQPHDRSPGSKDAPRRDSKQNSGER